MNKLVLILLAIFLPPVAVALKRGVGKDLLINILLCLLVFFPGMVHALWVVSDRLTRQRAPRPGRVALHLVIRRPGFMFSSEPTMPLLTGSLTPLIVPRGSGKASEPSSGISYHEGSRPSARGTDDPGLVRLPARPSVRPLDCERGRVGGHHENPGRNRSRHLRRDQSLRAGIHGPRPQGHPRPPARRSCSWSASRAS